MSQGKQMYYHYLRENIRNMNPKFKELAVKAGAYEDGNTVLTGPMDVAKFAELIVRECIETMYNTEQITVAQFVDATLKQHFGVES